ncbi:eukaryotic translation initiation factor 3 subunit D-like [Oppia nitens]|uniref:eukaryotic translation initiation factor 3 subunit D-like n=1 Tax=Oppia nitens TaxID=1686743 RepID=UPI0023DB1742|nr:eukaryotic translation initiation factor 3 subunit D-like [Oppia nitens]
MVKDIELVDTMSVPLLHFIAPEIQENPLGWGPNTVPEQYKDMPYQPFSKSDRIGKVADWTGQTYADKRLANKYQSQFGGGGQYSYNQEDDESSYQLVDTTRVINKMQRGRLRIGQRNARGRHNRPGGQQQMHVLSRGVRGRDKGGAAMRGKWQKNMRQKYDQKGAPQKKRDASVDVRPNWKIIEEMDFPRLSKLSLPAVVEGKDVYTCGALEYYDKTYDRVTTKNEKRLQRVNRIFHKVTTTDDPIIRQLSKTDGNVFATDAIIATLMCATRSVISWDIVVQKVDNKLFFDRRDESEFDLFTVNETAAEPPYNNEDGTNSINWPRNLALEATFINHNFSQQVLKTGEEKYKFENVNPFIQEDEEGQVASVAYRYRKWDLGDKVELVVRCEHDGVLIGPNGPQFINIKGLNEWDPRISAGIDWRQKLDVQRGAVLANELKNNACKLAKWTVQALLAGSDQIKFGYVSRVHFRDSSKHAILGTQQFKPKEFADQTNLNMDNAWGVLRCIIDTCMKLDDGKYLILKDPNKAVLLLYDIPDQTFETDEEEDSEDDDEEEDNEN